MLRHGFQGDVMRTFFLLSSLCVSILGNRFLTIRKLRFGEFHHLTMLATAGLMLLCQSTNFIVLFVALETVALAFYPLVAYNRGSTKSLEAGIKYLLFGALSSALLLLGIVLIYGVGANPMAWRSGILVQLVWIFFHLIMLPCFSRKIRVIYYYELELYWFFPGLHLRLGLLLSKFGCLMSTMAPPCHYCLLGSIFKGCGFFPLLNLVNGPFEGMSEFLLPLIGFVATFTILFGNLAACAQAKLKRMLGLSGVAHAGYLLVAVMASMHLAGDSDRAVWVVFFYLYIYLFASFVVFGVMGSANLSDDSNHETEHYAGL